MREHVVNADGTVTHVDHKHFGFEGRQLDYGWLLALLYSVGFRWFRLIRMAGVVTGESDRFIEAWHENIELDIRVNAEGEKYVHEETITSMDRGLPQINSGHNDQISPANQLKPIPAARYAFQLSDGGRNLDHWYAFRNRSKGYREGRRWAAWFFAFGTGWRRRVARVPEELG